MGQNDREAEGRVSDSGVHYEESHFAPELTFLVKNDKQTELGRLKQPFLLGVSKAQLCERRGCGKGTALDSLDCLSLAQVPPRRDIVGNPASASASASASFLRARASPANKVIGKKIEE
ncbi:unnamed protein product [Hydatigera taeniaeformis]|uniref:Uncharacterized protein n=1 Tax=Hydatigena taeniaeformis TaxID=6205 RepID=A0A0R3X476_HYDTA|nr:unnamed protein product [Hydatigera taeniaeformis]